jgi:hypothetical protein
MPVVLSVGSPIDIKVATQIKRLPVVLGMQLFPALWPDGGETSVQLLPLFTL